MLGLHLLQCRPTTCRLAFPGTTVRRLARRSFSAAAEPPRSPGHHQVPQGSVVSEEAVDPEIRAFQEHQATAPRLSLAEEARTLVANGRWGVLSTHSASEVGGFPFGSVVEYVADETGRPLFCFSSLSPHTTDIRSDARVSLTVLADGFRGLADARVNVAGVIAPLPEGDVPAAREAYLARHPNSGWVNFGDFKFFKLAEVEGARLVGGFGRIGSISAAQYAAAAPDPIAAFSAPVAGHMNADHAESTAAMVAHYVGITVDSASILTLDALGMNVECSRGGQRFKARLPFPRPAADRKGVKDLIVEMTRAAAAVAAPVDGAAS